MKNLFLVAGFVVLTVAAQADEPAIGEVTITYTALEGIDAEAGVMRRNPSDIVKVGDQHDDEIESLYNRIRLEWTDRDGSIPGAWSYSVHPWDTSVVQSTDGDEVEERSLGNPSFLFAVSIRFPVEDIPELVRRLREFNERWGTPVNWQSP